MAKDDNGNGGGGAAPGGSGLLSKVVRFVRNPTTNWSDLDQQDGDRDSGYSKQALKEMIERKRRNDFVRKREFDMLRKLRRREAMGAQNPQARPSFFQISTSSSKPDDRAMTLKKIDEIEEQMSMQWWKTKHGDSVERSTNFPVSAQPSTGGDAGADTAASPLGEDTQMPQGLKLRPDGDVSTNFPMTEPAPMALQTGNKAAPPAEPPLAPSLDLMASGFFGSEMFNVDVDDVAHDPELEEAAIRFANGDDAGAAAGLLEAISDETSRGKHEDTWLALFDLYRATGQQAPFEDLAERFSETFGRSSPAWFSMPDLVARTAKPKAAVAAPAPSLESIHWTCPAALTIEALGGLVSVLKSTPAPWHLDWRGLSSIQEQAVEPLYRQLSILADQPTQLAFVGGRHLDERLRDATPSGDRDVAQSWWLLRMVVLRILHRPDDFELAALNYCVTYEVSPPSWESPRCGYIALDGDGSGGGATIIGDVHESQMSSLGGVRSEFPSTAPADMVDTAVSGLAVDLSGQILGDAAEALAMLDEKLGEAQDISISCAALIRVDFSAAGTLLNWVSTRHAHGRRVHFSDVHRLVGAFFGVIGISELARVSLRRD